MHSLCRQNSRLAGDQYDEKNITDVLKITPHCDDIVKLFDCCFIGSFRTRLLKGGLEPEYIPATSNQLLHHIIFTKDYVSSALHEVAHWCVAGEARRLQHDYGYWYEPDGRNAQQQLVFESVEVKPQALEWLFSKACNVSFRVSADNLDAQIGVSDGFKCAIVEQVQHYCRYGVNERVGQFIDMLSGYYGTEDVLNPSLYSISDL